MQFSACFNVNQFCTLLWTNEYEFQFCSHDDIETLVPRCGKQWCKCANPTIHMGANLGCQLGGVEKWLSTFNKVL